MVEMDMEMADKLATACRILAKEGHSDMTSGPVSARHPGEAYLYMKPNGLGLEEVETGDIIVIDMEGNKVAGSALRKHVEFHIHAEIYKVRQDVNCVIHTHPPYSIALGAVGGRIRPIGHEGVLFVDLPIFSETSELIRTPEQGRAVAACLGSHRAALLRNHGIVVAGGSIEEATIYAISLEKAVKIQLLASLMGTPVWSSQQESEHKLGQIYYSGNINECWEYYVRRVKPNHPRNIRLEQ